MANEKCDMTNGKSSGRATKRPYHLRGRADSFAPEEPLNFLVGIDPDLHPLQNLQILFSEIEAGGFRGALIVARVRPQPDLEPQRQFHLITRFTQALNRFGNLRRILDRLIDGGADFANYLFCVVIDFQSLVCYASRRGLPTPNRQFVIDNDRLGDNVRNYRNPDRRR